VSSASSLVSIATEKLKPITDPILELLGVLHSVMYISQLPHEGMINHKRRVIDQFRRRLFSKESDGMKIKAELRKVLILKSSVNSNKHTKPSYLRQYRWVVKLPVFESLQLGQF
jgi:hypothetical protein